MWLCFQQYSFSSSRFPGTLRESRLFFLLMLLMSLHKPYLAFLAAAISFLAAGGASLILLAKSDKLIEKAVSKEETLKKAATAVSGNIKNGLFNGALYVLMAGAFMLILFFIGLLISSMKRRKAANV